MAVNEAFLKKTEALKEEGSKRANEANLKGLSLGPEVYSKKTILETIERNVSWFRYRMNVTKDVFFIKERHGFFSFDFAKYYTSQRNNVEGAVLHDQFQEFYKVALKQINEHTGMFSLESLVGKFDMSTSNAVFFIDYMLARKLVTEDPASQGTYYLASEYTQDDLSPKKPDEEDKPNEEGEPKEEKRPPRRKAIRDIEDPAPQKPHKKIRAKSLRKIEVLGTRLKELGPGSYSRRDIFDGTGVEPSHFYFLRNRIPYLNEVGTRRYSFDFWSFYDTEKMTRSGIELAKEVDRFFRKEIISLRNGSCSQSIDKIFTHNDLTSVLHMDEKNADFLIWYLLAYEIVKAREDGCYEWVAPEEIKWVAQSVGSGLYKGVKKSPQKAATQKDPKEQTTLKDFASLEEITPNNQPQTAPSGAREQELEAALRSVAARVMAVFECFDGNNQVRAGAELCRIKQIALAALGEPDGRN